jgi:glutamate racemase
MTIGVFDSGLGGLSVLHYAQKMFPNEHFIYYADEKHVPYGEKTPAEIRFLVNDIINFMIHKGVDIIMIACNTATSALSMAYRKRFPIQIIGMEPAVKKAIDLYGDENKRILVVATPVTIKGKKLNDLVERIDSRQKVDMAELPQLVRYAEKGIFSSTQVSKYLQQALQSYDLQSYGTVVIGCTHFNYFKKDFQKLFQVPLHFVDGNEGTVRQMMRVLSLSTESSGDGITEYYFSGKSINESELKLINSCMLQLDQVFDIN